MSARIRERAQDILIGALFGIVLGLISGLWASAYDHLFLEGTDRSMLIVEFIFFTIGLVAAGGILFWYAKQMGNKDAKHRAKIWHDAHIKMKSTSYLQSRKIRIVLALLVILSYVGVSAYFLPTILADYTGVIHSLDSRTFTFPININLKGTVEIANPPIMIGLTFTYSKGTLIVDEPVKVKGHAVIDEVISNISAIVVNFQNCLEYPIKPVYKGIPKQGFIIFNATDRFLDFNTLTGTAVYNILGNATITWSVDGASKPILGILYDDGTNTTMTIEDLVLNVYPKEQLTQVQTNKVTTELTIAVFIFAFFGVFSIASDIWHIEENQASAYRHYRLATVRQKSQLQTPNSKQKNQEEH